MSGYMEREIEYDGSPGRELGYSHIKMLDGRILFVGVAQIHFHP